MNAKPPTRRSQGFIILFGILCPFLSQSIKPLENCLSFHLIQSSAFWSNSICYGDQVITLDSIFGFTTLMGQTHELLVQSILKDKAFQATLGLYLHGADAMPHAIPRAGLS